MGLLQTMLAIRDAAIQARKELQNLQGFETAVDRIHQKLEEVIAQLKTSQEILAELATATTAVGQEIIDLVAQLGSNPTAAELDEFKAGVAVQTDRLTAMGTKGQVDPANP